MKSDAESIKLAKYALDTLGCPPIMDGENNPHFIPFNSKIKNVVATPYRKTPDLLAGPNNGDMLDFYIDVNSPDGKMLKNKKGPLSKLVRDLEEMKTKLQGSPGQKAQILISSHDKEYLNQVANPFSNKINKYGTERKSHMFGFVSVFDGRGGNAEVMALDMNLELYADFIFQHLRTILPFPLTGLHQQLHSEENKLVTFSVPIDSYISFYLLTGFGKLKNKGLLLVNHNVITNPTYIAHPVVSWLNQISHKRHIRVPSF